MSERRVPDAGLVAIAVDRAVAYLGAPRGAERERPIVEQIEGCVARLGAETAFIAPEGTWTLAETWTQVLALAARLHEAMKGEPKPVVVVAPKGLTQVASLLACFRLGVPYIPIDPADDSLRSRHVMALAAPFVLVRDARGTRLWEAMAPAAAVVVFDPAAEPGAPGALPPPPEPTAHVMVIFTSGSTGVPKGVALSQAEIVDAHWRRQDYWKLEPGDRAIYHGSLVIIGMALNTLAPLLGGGSTVMMAEAPTVAQVIDALIRHEGTLIAGYIGFLRLLAQHPDAPRALARLKSLTVYGDRMEWRDVAEFRAAMPNGALLTYDYGLSEICFAIGGYLGEAEPSGTVPMGVPHPGIELWFEGEPEREADGALVGALAITLPEGQRGYWRSAQDAARYAAHPADPELRVFLTGDIVRLQADGVFRFLGRSDNQVKVRGQRIELEEIELAAREAPGVAVAGVVPRRDGDGNVTALVLHVASRPGKRTTAEVVARHVRKALPRRVWPNAVVLSPALPLTATAKIDRTRLAELDAELRERRAARRSGEQGDWQDPLERRLAAALAEELERKDLPAASTFQELGGDSLAALAAALHIEKVFGVTIDPALLLTEEPLGDCVAAIAAQVREERAVPA